MRRIKAILIFHWTLFVPSIAVSIILALLVMTQLGEFSITAVGIAYLFIPLFMQYFRYEVRNKGVYYFYYNLGLNKLVLWGGTLVIDIIIAGLITLISWMGYTLIV